MAKTKTKRKATSKGAANWELPHVVGKTFTITGTLQDCDRAEAERLIKAEGGKIAKSVTSKLDYLIVGATKGGGTSAAEKKADSLNQSGKASIQILDESAFHQLFVRDRDAAIALLQSGRDGILLWNKTVGREWLKVSVDVTNADFRDCDLKDARLSHANLDGSDFRGAQLNGVSIRGIRDAKFDKAEGIITIYEADNCSFKDVDFSWGGGSLTARNSNLDGAKLKNASVYELKDCTAKRADFTCVRFNPADLSRADLTGAKMPSANGYSTQGAGACFDKADMREARFDRSKFRGASFQKADLRSAMLEECDFTAADLSGANLEKADASRANFQNANLTKANFRGAMLSDADFTGAILDGADFTDAGVVGAKLTEEQIKAAKGLKIGTTTAGKIGSNIRELEKIARQCQKLSIDVRADLEKGKHVLLSVQSWSGNWGSGAGGYETIHSGNSSRGLPGPGNSVSSCMLGLANRWAQGTPRLDEIKVSASKSPLKRKELELLVLAAWCEAFGLEIPTEDELKQRAKKSAKKSDDLREKALADLKSGSQGVEKWNKLTEDQRKSIRRMRKVDFSGLDLSNGNFDKLDLQAADFSDCKLQDARFWLADLKKAKLDRVNARGVNLACAKLNDASCREADLAGANLRACNFLRTSFVGSDLSKSDASGSDFRGADFTDAKLSKIKFAHCKFDEETKFPAGYKIPEALIWAGQGKDPRLMEKVKQVQSAGPIDFESFMKQLANNFDESRLNKAMKMLKAESFQLFAQVEDNSVTGVVKSQTDPDLVYSCRLDSEGTFACCTQNLNPCGGLRGALCKHLLVLIVGLTKGEELDPTTINTWVAASKLQGPNLDKDLMSEVFLKYKGAEAGEIDWRPTETVPEDFYAF